AGCIRLGGSVAKQPFGAAAAGALAFYVVHVLDGRGQARKRALPRAPNGALEIMRNESASLHGTNFAASVTIVICFPLKKLSAGWADVLAGSAQMAGKANAAKTPQRDPRPRSPMDWLLIPRPASSQRSLRPRTTPCRRQNPNHRRRGIASRARGRSVRRDG